MRKQTLKWDGLGGNIVQILQPKKTVVKKEYVKPQWMVDYILKRDRILWKMFPGSRLEIEEMHKGYKKVEVEESQLIMNI